MVALASMRFNADGLIARLRELKRDFESAEEILLAANDDIALLLAERAVEILKDKEVGRRPLTNVLEEALVDPENRIVTYSGFQFGIESFLDSRTGGRGTPYWRMIEGFGDHEAGVQGFTRYASFTDNENRSGPYTVPGEGAGQRFMPTVRNWSISGSDASYGAFPSEWRQVTIAARPAYHPIALASEALISGEINVFEIYREAFARRGISLVRTNLGSRGLYVTA